MAKFKYSIYAAEVGGELDSKHFDSALAALQELHLDISSYECEEEFADEREIEEAKNFNPHAVFNELKPIVLSPFFGEVSVWLPGHNRKFSITREEEQSNG